MVPKTLAVSADSMKLLERALARVRKQKYVLRLYVAGATAQSARAITNLKAICEEHLKGRYQLEVVDLYQRPQLALDEEIVAAPTLIKALPPPVRRIIGDLSNSEPVLVGLGLRKGK